MAEVKVRSLRHEIHRDRTKREAGGATKKKGASRQLILVPDKPFFGEVLIGIKRIIHWLYQAEQTRDITLENDIFCIFI